MGSRLFPLRAAIDERTLLATGAAILCGCALWWTSAPFFSVALPVAGILLPLGLAYVGFSPEERTALVAVAGRRRSSAT